MDDLDARRDPRITPARPDLAARHLEGRIDAARFVDGEPFEIVDAIAPLHGEPSPAAPLLTQALKGERVTIYDRNAEGWAWGQLDGDGYVGWLPERALKPPGRAPTHKITALRTFSFPGPSIKLAPNDTLPLGAALVIVGAQNGFAVTDDGAFVPARHLGVLDRVEQDFVAVAERFVGTPYLWGGKSSLGIDCSGLVQIALNACGIPSPRDSDMQQAALGAELSRADRATFKRGDLLFWKGHVAIARDASTMVHANAHAMATAIEPISEAIARIMSDGGALIGVKRLTGSDQSETPRSA